jgi:hypothetical protein
MLIKNGAYAMIKGVIYSLTIIIGMWIIGEPPMAEEKSTKSNEVQIILHQKGKQKLLDNHSPNFQDVLDECERLFLTADDTYLLIVTDDLVERVKKQRALEVTYPTVQKKKIRKELTIYFTRLLIPLTGRFSNGTVFFAGIHEYELKRDNPDLLPEQNYNYIDRFRAVNFVVNTKGLSKLKETLKKMSIKIDWEDEMQKRENK